MKKPFKPLPTDCCGSGCSRCIYEIYDQQIEKYNKWKIGKEENKNRKDVRTTST